MISKSTSKVRISALLAICAFVAMNATGCSNQASSESGSDNNSDAFNPVVTADNPNSAVTDGLSTYCTHLPSDLTYSSSWNSAGNDAVYSLGHWVMRGTYPGGYVYVRVTPDQLPPNATGGVIEAEDSASAGLMSDWGCPATIQLVIPQ